MLTQPGGGAPSDEDEAYAFLAGGYQFEATTAYLLIVRAWLVDRRSARRLGRRPPLIWFYFYATV